MTSKKEVTTLYRLFTQDVPPKKKSRLVLKKMAHEAFPDGFTMYPAKGQWTSPKTGKAVDEDSIVIEILAVIRTLNDAIDVEKRIAMLVNNIKVTNHQESVLVQRINTDSDFV